MKDIAIPTMTMSSREIADLMGKRHDHVLRDIRMMLTELYGEGGVPSFEDTLITPQNGQSYPVFMLPKRETMILISGYNTTLRARIIDRWQQLETSLVPTPIYYTGSTSIPSGRSHAVRGSNCQDAEP